MLNSHNNRLKLSSLLLLSMISLVAMSQSNPSPHVLKSSDLVFKNFRNAEVQTNYPTSFRGWTREDFPANVVEAPGDVQAESNTPLCISCVNDADAISNVGLDGFSIQRSNDPTLYRPIALAFALNTIDCENIDVYWVGEVLLKVIPPSSSGIQLQYRIGTTGDWINLENQTLLSSSRRTSFSTVLPTAAENQPRVQLRWLIFAQDANQITDKFGISGMLVHANTINGEDCTDCYCPADNLGCDGVNNADPDRDHITRVTMTSDQGDFEHLSGCDGYEDNTDQIITTSIGNANTISVERDVNLIGGQAAVWIDYNENLIFESTEMVASGNTSNGAFNGLFTIPATTPVGTKRMRIRISETEAPQACGIQHYSEVEDYTIQIGSTPDCAINPSPEDGATGYCGDPVLEWATADENDLNKAPSGYRVFFGTNNPPTNMVNGVDVGNSTSYDISEFIVGNTNYFWRIEPYNNLGSTTDCEIWQFATPTDGFILASITPDMDTIQVCQFADLTLNGNPRGGDQPYIHVWTVDGGLNNDRATTPDQPVTNVETDATGLFEFNYTVEDAQGCTATDIITVNVTSQPTVQINSNVLGNGPTNINRCSNQSQVLRSNVEGGSTPQFYSWAGEGIITDRTLEDATFQLREGGDYPITFTVTDTFGCTASDEVNMHVNPEFFSNITPDEDPIKACRHQEAILLDGNPSGGSLPYEHEWINDGGRLTSTTTQTTTARTNELGTYQFIYIVTDDANCEARDTVNYVVTTSPSTNPTPSDNFTVCGGVETTINANPSGGSLPYTHTWSGDVQTLISDKTKPEVTFFTEIPGNYTLNYRVDDPTGCFNEREILIEVFPTLKASPTPAHPIKVCKNEPLTINGNPSGGFGDLKHFWTGNTDKIDATDVPEVTFNTSEIGTFSLTYTVRDDNQCEVISPMSVSVSDGPTAAIVPSAPINLCAGETFNISATTSGGLTPYNHTWTSDLFGTLTTPSISITPENEGTFDIVYAVTDDAGCPSEVTTQVTVNPGAPTIGITPESPVICANDLLQLRGNPNSSQALLHQWRGDIGPLSSSTIENPTFKTPQPGEYNLTYTITDQNGCTRTDAIAIAVNPSVSPKIQISTSSTVICDGESVEFTAQATDAGPSPSYQWFVSSVASGIDEPTFSSSELIDGDVVYCVVSTNTSCSNPNNQRSNNIFMTVGDFVVPTIKITATNSTQCEDEAAQFTAQTTDEGDNPTFDWIVNGQSTGITTNTFSSTELKDGDKISCILTSNAPCLAENDIESNQLTISTASELTPSIEISTENLPACKGGDIRFRADAVNEGSQAQYAWFINNNLQQGQNTKIFVTNDFDHNDRVHCELTSSLSCAVPSSATSNTVVIDTLDIRIEIDPVDPQCFDSPELQLRAAEDGGIWRGVGITSAQNGRFNPAIAGEGTHRIVYEKIKSSCIFKGVIDISVNDKIIVDAGLDRSFCADEASDILGGFPTAEGGSGGFSYNWTPNTGFLDPPTNANPRVRMTRTETFNVEVTDFLGCKADESVTITINDPLEINAGSDQESCSGEMVSLGGNPTVIEGNPPYAYSWSPGENLSDPTDENPNASPTSTTNYTLTVTDSKGCLREDIVMVSVFLAPVINAGDNNTVCKGTEITLGGNPTIVSGNGNIELDWSPANLLTSNNDISNPTALINEPVIFTLTAEDEIGCISEATVEIGTTKDLIVDAGDNQIVCSDECTTLGGDIVVQNGVAPYTFEWTPTEDIDNPMVSNPTVCPSLSLIYTLRVTDAADCKGEDQVTIELNPMLSANAGNDASICTNQKVTLGNGVATGTGGSGVITYKWEPSELVSDPSNATPTAVISAAQGFTITITDGNGCTAEDDITVGALPLPKAHAYDGDLDKIESCEASILQLGANGATGGNAPYTYFWKSTKGTAFSPSNTEASPTITLSENEGFAVTVTDANGCKDSNSVNVISNENPVAIFTFSDAGDGSGVVTFQNVSLDAVEYLWEFGDDSTSTFASPIHQYATTGRYDICLTAISANGCTNRLCSEVNITVTSISEFEGWTNVKAYPIPTAQHLYLDISALQEMPTSVSLIDLTGRTVKQYDTEQQYGSVWMFDCSDVPAGQYQLRVVSSTRTGVKKVLIAH